MTETKENQVLTVGVFNEALDRFELRLESKFVTKNDLAALQSKMMEGFEIVFDRFEKVEQKIDDLAVTKVEREEFLPLYKRVTKLERKLA